MNDNTNPNPPWYQRHVFTFRGERFDVTGCIVIAIVLLAVLGIPGGPFLWWYTGSPAWIVWTVCAVILGLAG